MTLTIHPDLQSLIPPLTPEELAQLEANLLAEGCRDPLMVWAEEQILLDGHNRLDLCERHGLEYRLHEISLPSLEAAKAWMIANQLGRRNLTPEQTSYFRGEQYNLQKRQGKRTDLTSDHSDPKSQNTAQVLADQHRVSEPTIKRDGAYAAAIDSLSEAVGPEVRQTLLSRDMKLTQRDVKVLATIATKSVPKAKEALEAAQGAKTPKQGRKIVQAKAREVRDYEHYMDGMIRSHVPETEWPASLRPRPTPTPEMQQRAWNVVYVEELGRRITKALDSLDHLRAHLVGDADDPDWLAVQLPALLGHEAALCLRLSTVWGHVERLLRRSETVPEGRCGLAPAPTLAEAPPPAPEEESAAAPTGVWCLWCGMTINTADDEVRHQEQCAAARGEAPSPAEYIAAMRGQEVSAPAPAAALPKGHTPKRKAGKKCPQVRRKEKV